MNGSNTRPSRNWLLILGAVLAVQPLVQSILGGGKAMGPATTAVHHGALSLGLLLMGLGVLRSRVRYARYLGGLLIGLAVVSGGLGAMVVKKKAGVLDEIAASENARLPRMIDAEIELSRVDVDRRVLTYNYRWLEPPDSELLDARSSQIERSLERTACDTEALRRLLEEGVRVRHLFRDGEAAEVLSVEVSHQSCR